MQEADVVKFFKHLSGRLVHGLVTARLGQPQAATPCITKLDDASDWFNLKITELSDVAAQIRAVTAVDSFPPQARSFSLDFHASTPQGLVLPLESWHLCLEDGNADPYECLASNRHFGGTMQSAVYHQMGVLLRSALCAARATPAYRRYMRRQSPDTCVILYEIYAGPSQLERLGEETRTVKIGTVLTPCGNVTLEVNCRTQLSLSVLLEAQDQCVQVENEHGIKMPLTDELIGATPVTAQRTSSNRSNDSWGNDSSPNIACSPVEPAMCSFSTSPAKGGNPIPGTAGRHRQSSVCFQLGSSPVGDAPVGTMAAGHSASTGHLGSLASGQQATQVKRNDSSLFFEMDSDPNLQQQREGATLRRLSVGRVTSVHQLHVNTTPTKGDKDRGIRHAQSGTWTGDAGAVAVGAATPRSLPTEHTHMSTQQLLQQQLARQRKASAGANFPFASLLAASYSAPTLDLLQAATGQTSSATGSLLPVVKSPLPRLTEDESNGNGVAQKLGDLQVKQRDLSPGQDGDGDEAGRPLSRQSGYNSDDSDDSFVKLPSAAVFAQQHEYSEDPAHPASGSGAQRLGDFVAQCKSAPHKLKSFGSGGSAPGSSQQPTVDIGEQLKELEGKRMEFENFVKNLKGDE